MKFMKGASLFVIGVLLVGLIVGCQSDPVSPNRQDDFTSYRLIKASPEILGLAKGVWQTDTMVYAAFGDTLMIESNYVAIPGGALPQDFHMTLTILVTDSNELMFEIEGAGVPEGEHIYFENGMVSNIAVDKDWIAERPEVGINLGTNEIYEVTETASHYQIKVPHFTGWGFGSDDD